MYKKNYKEKKWYRLDNTAKVFPIISNKKSSNVFRVSVSLNNNIIKEKLQLALDKTLPFFKTFQVNLKKGFFWYYFETNSKKVTIDKENKYPCSYMNFKEQNKFLFKVTYYKNRINLEVFHSLTDGSGAIEFLKAITYNYIKLVKYNKQEKLSLTDLDFALDNEDSYVKNYSNLHLNLNKTNKAYLIKSRKLPLYSISVISGYMNINELLTLCRSKNVTITEYITTLLISSIYSEYQSHTKNKDNIKIFIPVNLRKYFDSSTNLNFFSSIDIDTNLNENKSSFNELLKKIQLQFKEKLTKDHLSKKISNNVSAEQNIFVRLLPLPIKTIGVKIAYNLQKNSHTSTISNLGIIDIKDEFKTEIN
ncbi:MAG: hypothetical protein RSC92_05725, partial [Clostridia bacterium]